MTIRRKRKDQEPRSPALQELFDALSNFRREHRDVKVDEVRFRFGPNEGGPQQMEISIMRRHRDGLLQSISIFNLGNVFLFEKPEVLPDVVYESLLLKRRKIDRNRVRLCPPLANGYMVKIYPRF